MYVTHPYARRDTAPPSAATVNGDDYPIDSDGVVEAPEDVAVALADAWADRYDVPPDGLLHRDPDTDESEGNDTCDAIKSDGDVCGRALPCRYHSDGGD